MFQMENTEANAIAVLANPVKDVARGDLVAVHEDYKIQDLEIFQGGRERARGVLKPQQWQTSNHLLLTVSSAMHLSLLIIKMLQPHAF